MAEIQRQPIRYLDALPSVGLFPGEFVVVFSRSGPVGQFTYSVSVHVWDDSESAWDQLPTLSDTLTGDMTITGALTAGSVNIGSANISEAELETIDGITPGTVVANKAVVVDALKDVGTFGGVIVTTLNASGNVQVGSLTSSGIVTSDSGFTINAAQINEAELETIDGVTPGTSAASKVLVPDSNLELDGIGVIRKQDTLITSAQVLALNAAPITVVTAPAADVFAEFLGAYILLDFNTAAYAGIAAGEDLVFRYTNGSGVEVSQQVETTGLMDAVADEIRVVRPAYAATGSVEPVSAAAIVLHLLSAEIITGNSPLKVRVYYRLTRKAALEAIA